MNLFLRILHWLFDFQNPIPIWGFFPCLIWFIFLAFIAVYFATFETLGGYRAHGMVMLTWVLRPVVPRIVWIVAGPIAVWHFDFVKTHATQLFKYLSQ